MLNKNKHLISKYKNCPFCNSKNLKIKIRTKLLTVIVCNKCNLHFVPRFKNKKENLSRYYDGLNFNDIIAYYGPYRRNIFKKNWNTIKKWNKSGSALDIGCSFGWFLETAPKNWKVTGLEPSESVAKFARSSGFNVIVESDEFLEKHKLTYDLITLWNVIEHLPDPKNSLLRIKKCLRPNGVIGISFPNRLGIYNRLAYLAHKLSGDRINTPIHVMFQVERSTPHLFHFTVNDVKKLLNLSGFKIIKEDIQPIIDFNNLDLRLKIEGSKKGMIINLLGKRIMYVLYLLSNMLNMPDEIVIYARNEKSDKSGK